MKAQSNIYSAQDNSEIIENEIDEINEVKIYLLDPLKVGVMGFAAFFSIILITTAFGYLVGFQESFNIGLNDVIFSLTGFVLAAGSKFMSFFSNE
ncbi:MAG: hypothetical protein V3V16_10915 [Melioribacteraceae bacterium]